MRSFVILAIAACSSASSADPHQAAPPPEPVVRAPAPPPIPLLTREERERRAAAIARTFPAAQHAIVRIDVAGMIESLELTRTPPTEDVLLELVRAHATELGVTDPGKLHVMTASPYLLVGEGPRWTGTIEMFAFDNHVRLTGHLWPVSTPAPPALDMQRVLAPFVGLDGTEPSKCLCPRDTLSVTTRPDMFEVRNGVAFVCDHGALRARQAYAIVLTSHATVPGLATLPALYDAHSHEPIDADYLMPVTGSLEAPPRGVGALTERRHDCLKW